QWIVMYSEAPQEDLYVVKTDGSGLRQLTNDLPKDRAPMWSPDGQRILFYSDRSDKYAIWMISPDGSGLRQLKRSGGPVYAPMLSPDGKHIAYEVGAGGVPNKAHLADINASYEITNDVELPQLPDPDRYFDDARVRWSPDG